MMESPLLVKNEIVESRVTFTLLLILSNSFPISKEFFLSLLYIARLTELLVFVKIIRGRMLFVKTVKFKANVFSRRHGILIQFLVVFIMISTACSPERKLVKSFVYDQNKRSALLIAPQYIYKTNLKKNILDSLGIKDERLFDSVLMANSDFLKDIQDSMFIANYLLGMDMELKRFGFQVYREIATSSFMENDSNAYLINLAQIEIEEAYYTKRDEISMYNTYYYHDHQLNAAYVNSWIEVNEINAEAENHNVYFSSDIITDDLQGEFQFDYFSGQVKYLYEVDSLKPAEIYNFAYMLGRTYAGYTFDLLMNNFLKEKLPEEKRSGKYWRFNPVLENFFYAEDDKFIPLND